MDNDSLFAHIERLKGLVRKVSGSFPELRGAQAQIIEFLGEFAGPKSSFLQMAQHASGGIQNIAETLVSALESYRSYVEAGLQGEVTPARRAQLDVVSDFLEQAHSLLEAKGVHPAAPMLIEKDGFLVFTKDAEFSSPSAAAVVIHGGSANGLTAWKTKDGRSLKQLDEEA
jgi:hypothetical protein